MMTHGLCYIVAAFLSTTTFGTVVSFNYSTLGKCLSNTAVAICCCRCRPESDLKKCYSLRTQERIYRWAYHCTALHTSKRQDVTRGQVDVAKGAHPPALCSVHRWHLEQSFGLNWLSALSCTVFSLLWVGGLRPEKIEKKAAWPGPGAIDLASEANAKTCNL